MRDLHPLATEARPTDGSAAARLERAWQGMDVPASESDMPEARATARRSESQAACMAGKEAGAVIVNHRHQVGNHKGAIVSNVQIVVVRVFDFGSKS